MAEHVPRVLIPLDGSPEAERILPALMPLLRHRHPRVMLFHVVERGHPARPARNYLETLRRSLEADGVPAEVMVDWGKPAERLISLSRSRYYDFIAMTTHGRTGLRRALLGSVAEKVLRRVEIPLIVNRPDAKVGDWKRMVVALDGSARSEEILPEVERLAKFAGATVFLLGVKTPGFASEGSYADPGDDPIPYLHGISGRLAREGVAAMAARREGMAAAEIAGYAKKVGAGLVCLTTHGRKGLSRTLLGSVAEEVLRTAPCPVFVRRAAPIPAYAQVV
jgi:nucleotide-binding universal stress UspA family protein